jgi:hypothetical protein
VVEKINENKAPQEESKSLFEQAYEKIEKETQSLLEKLKKWYESTREAKEAPGRFIEKDGYKFKVMEFGSDELKDQMDTLEAFVLGIQQKIEFDKDGNEMMPGIKTAAQLIDALPYSKRLDTEARGWLKKYVLATSNQESGHRYALLATEPVDNEYHLNSRGLARYQFMPRMYMEWSKLYLGEVVEPTPQAIEYIAYRRFMEYYENININPKSNRYMFYTAMANSWFWGHTKTLKIPDIGKIKIGTVSESTKYSKEVLEKMGLKRDKATATVQEALSLYRKGGKEMKKAKTILKEHYAKLKEKFK